MLEMDPVMTVFPLLLSFNFCVSTPLISPSLGEAELEMHINAPGGQAGVIE